MSCGDPRNNDHHLAADLKRDWFFSDWLDLSWFATIELHQFFKETALWNHDSVHYGFLNSSSFSIAYEAAFAENIWHRFFKDLTFYESAKTKRISTITKAYTQFKLNHSLQKLKGEGKRKGNPFYSFSSIPFANHKNYFNGWMLRMWKMHIKFYYIKHKHLCKDFHQVYLDFYIVKLR